MTNETLADILRDMRNPENDYITNNDLRDLADRLEAAAKREKVEAVALAAGQAVKLTDEKWRRDIGNGAAIHTALDSVRIEMLKRLAGIQPQISDMGILELCVDAQHKPVRNCDMENCAWDAQVEFRRTFRDPYGNPAPSGDDAAYWSMFVNWLFAPAEGGEK